MNAEDFQLKYLEARALYQAGQPDQALERIEALLAQRPGHRDLRYSRALCLERLGHAREALVVCSELLQEEPDARVQTLRDRLQARFSMKETLRPEKRYIPSEAEAQRLLAQLEEQAREDEGFYGIQLTTRRLTLLIIILALVLAVLGPMIWWTYFGLRPN